MVCTLPSLSVCIMHGFYFYHPRRIKKSLPFVVVCVCEHSLSPSNTPHLCLLFFPFFSAVVLLLSKSLAVYVPLQLMACLLYGLFIKYVRTPCQFCWDIRIVKSQDFNPFRKLDKINLAPFAEKRRRSLCDMFVCKEFWFFARLANCRISLDGKLL